MKKLVCIAILTFAVGCGSDEPNAGNNGNNGENNGNNGNNGTSNNGTGNNNGTIGTSGNNGSDGCVETIVYDVDADGDGFAPTDAPASMMCLTEAEKINFITARGDCNDNDPIQFPNSPGVCGDLVVDDCTGDGPDMQGQATCEDSEAPCPDTQAGTLDDPNWDCTGDPPDNVYAFAKFDAGNAYYQDGACFVFFEGFADGFYAKHNLDRVNQDPSCDTAAGCVCPSAGNRPSYDRRLYAFTTDADQAQCPIIELRDHGCSEALIQPVSNDCRKYLYQMHPFELNGSDTPIDRPYSYMAGSLEEMQTRLESFETIEVACAATNNTGLEWAVLMSSTVEFNANFVKK